jgi:hypothetical protein
MQRIEFDLSTGEQQVITLTEVEEALYLASLPPEPDPLPNWDMLYGRLLAYDLKPIFESIKAIAKTDTAINWDLTALATAIATIRTEQALKDCLDELVADGYVISNAHKALWNTAIAQENFSDLVKIL